MIKVKRLGHATLSTPDIDGQIDYYSRVLGLSVVDRSKDRVFLCVEARDPKFDLEATRRLLAGLHPRDVWEVPR